MKRMGLILLALMILLNGLLCLPAAAAEPEPMVTMVADFESSVTRSYFQNGQYNFFSPTYSESTAIRASGSSAVGVKFGNLGTNLHQFIYSPTKTIDLSGADFIMFYFKNESALPMAITFGPQTFIITSQNLALTGQPDFWKNYMGQRFQSNHDWGRYPAQVYDDNTGKWVAASKEQVGTGNGADVSGFTLGAGFDGYVRIPLDATEKVTSYGLSFTMNCGSSAADNKYPMYSEYNGASFVIDDILLLGGSGEMTLSQYFAKTLSPKGLVGIAPTSEGAHDGRIIGAASTMEYRPVDDAEYIPCTGSEITGLAPGLYSVRFKESNQDITVRVPDFIAEPTIFVEDMFQDHMVIQRNKPIVIHGTCTEGDTVTVTFGGQEETAEVKNGAWSVTLAPMAANATPQFMGISAGSQTLIITDILIGDVWLCSGQSNMDFKINQLPSNTLTSYNNAKNNEKIRYFLVTRGYNQTPQKHFAGDDHWCVTDAAEYLNYSAYALSFAAALQESLNIPIGIVDASYGGTSIQHWMSSGALAAAGTGHGESFYNAMIHPMNGFAIKGILWYQGESNIQQSISYTTLFKAYADDYRQFFGDANLPIITTQLPRYTADEYPRWAEFRLEQWEIARSMNHVEIVCGIDMGEPSSNLHPTDKFEFGFRAGQLTLHTVYGKDVPGTSAYPKALYTTDGGWKIRFENASSGLKIEGDTVKELYFVRSNGKQVQATARIEDGYLIVDGISGNAKYLEYCLTSVPDGNLYTENGLPVAPFRLTLADAKGEITEESILKQAIPDHTVVLTFDDALKNHFNNVAPVLQEYGFDATFFVSELYFEVYGVKNYTEGVQKGVYMTWDEIASLYEQGFDIGSHSMTHHDMTVLSKSAMQAEVDDLEARCIENGIKSPVTFAYPGLVYNADIIDYLSSHGYTFARSGLADTYNPLKQHPLKVMGTDAHLDYNGFVEQVNKAVDGKIVVLIYHDVPNRAAFAKTMAYLKENTFTVLSMRDLEEYIDPEIAAAYFEETPNAGIPDPEYTDGKTSFAYPEDFNLSTQGLEGFYYMYSFDGKLEYAQVVGGYWGTENPDEAYCRIAADMMHPGNKADPVLCWVAPQDGTVRITGSIKPHSDSADGVRMTVFRDKGELKKVDASGGKKVKIDIASVQVKAGERLYFELNCNGNNGSDTTAVNITIDYYSAFPQSAIAAEDGWTIGFGQTIQASGDSVTGLTLIKSDKTEVETQGSVTEGGLVTVDGKGLTDITGIKYSSGNLIDANNQPVPAFEVSFKAAPNHLIATAGTISGVNTNMEYRRADETEYHPVQTDTIEGLAAGSYYVRYAAGANELSLETAVVVPAYEEPGPGDDDPSAESGESSIPDEKPVKKSNGVIIAVAVTAGVLVIGALAVLLIKRSKLPRKDSKE